MESEKRSRYEQYHKIENRKTKRILAHTFLKLSVIDDLKE